jgi:hypothetical protein
MANGDDVSVSITECSSAMLPEVKPILLLAEPVEEALNWSLSHMSDVVYRMDVDDVPAGAASVRRDYFWYLHTPQYENGIQVRDMIVFSYEIS